MTRVPLCEVYDCGIWYAVMNYQSFAHKRLRIRHQQHCGTIVCTNTGAVLITCSCHSRGGGGGPSEGGGGRGPEWPPQTVTWIYSTDVLQSNKTPSATTRHQPRLVKWLLLQHCSTSLSACLAGPQLNSLNVSELNRLRPQA